MTTTLLSPEEISAASEKAGRILEGLGQVLYGQDELLRLTLWRPGRDASRQAWRLEHQGLRRLSQGDPRRQARPV